MPSPRFVRAFLALRLWAVCALLCLAPLSAVLAAGQPIDLTTEDERLVRWDLTADKVVTLNDSEIMEAHGNVYLRRGNEYLKADFARYYMSTKWVYLKGNVQVRTGRDELTAEEAEFDLRSRVGWLKRGRIFMAGPHVYLAGDRIDKHWGDVYTFRDAKVTTCDGDVPAWSVTAEEAVVEIDGYARLSHSTFQVKDTPVAYAPWFIFPTKTTRQTGFLVPEFGRSSTKGVYYNQPYFWAINESSDLTVNEMIMEKRGFMHGVEYRARPSASSAYWLRFDFLYDHEIKSHQGSGPYAGDGYRRTNHDRYWLRGMMDTVLPDPAWRFKADLDYVSDQYFLSEFKDGFNGFKRSRNELFDLFRRDIAEKDLSRVSGLLLTRDWERFSLAFSGQYTQDPYLGHGNASYSSDTTVQRLPQVDAFLHKGRIFPEFPLEIDAAAQGAYLYRRAGTRGARYELTPQLTLPLNSRYGSLIASFGVVETRYDTERADKTRPKERNRAPIMDEPDDRQTGEWRTVPEFSVAGATELARVFSFDRAPLPASNSTMGQSQILGLRHSVQPRVEFVQRANVDQADNPYYSDEDRLLPRTELVYSLTNVLTAKKEKVVLREKPDDGKGRKGKKAELEPTLETRYEDIVRLRLEQAYDFREATRNRMEDRYERRPFGDIFADLTIKVLENVDFKTRNNWSPYLNALTRHQSGLEFTFPEWGTFYAGVDLRKSLKEYTRWRDEDVQYLRFDVRTAPIGAFSLAGSFRQDYVDLSNRETEVSLTYNHQCFQLTGSFSHEPQETNFKFMVVLTGLGD